jgi:hypothetical protein
VTRRALASLGSVFVGLATAAPPAVAQQAAPAEPAAPAAHEDHHEGSAPSLLSAREASGTAWQPDVSPMHGLHGRAGAWELMLHGNGFIQFLYEASPEHRGGTQAGSINWAMGMARRPIGPGRFGLRSMISLEPWTIPGCGYPNLLATGELCDGDSIHDRQHPHDLFMEVAAEWDQALAGALQGAGRVHALLRGAVRAAVRDRGQRVGRIRPRGAAAALRRRGAGRRRLPDVPPGDGDT